MQREVIKWTQSLDLSYPVKHPRRDLANGFLFAEILSRYDRELQMHSFDTGAAMARRIDNWALISKSLERLGCRTVTKEMIEGTIQMRGDNSARDALDQLYMFLTKRTLKPNVLAPAPTTQLQLPGHMRPTAAALLREANDASKLRLQAATGQLDETKIHRGNEDLLKAHRTTLQALKFAEPERYQPAKPKAAAGGGYAAMHSAQRAAGGRGGGDSGVSPSPRKEKPRIVKAVETRPLDAALLSTFAQRDAAAREEAFRSGFSRDEDIGTALSRIALKPLASLGLVEAIEQQCPGDASAASAGGCFAKFLLVRRMIDLSVRRRVWRDVIAAARNAARLIQFRPEEFAQLTNVLAFVFSRQVALGLRRSNGGGVVVDDCAGKDEGGSGDESDGGEHADGGVAVEDSDAFDVGRAFALLRRVGAELLAIAPELAARVCEMYLLPALATTVAVGSAGVVEAAARVLAAYVHANHLDGVQRLLNNAIATARSGGGGSTGGVNSSSSVADGDRVAALLVLNILRSLDLSVCIGIDAVCAFHATQFSASSSAVARAAAWSLWRLILPRVAFTAAAGTGGAAAAAATPAALSTAALVLPAAHRAVAAGTRGGGGGDWEERMALLDFAVALHRQITVAEDAEAFGSTGGGDAPGGGADAAFQELINLLGDLANAASAVFSAFNTAPSAQRRHTLWVVGGQLLPDAQPQLAALFVQRIASFRTAANTGDMHALLHSNNSSGSAAVQAIAGRAKSLYETGGLNARWDAASVAQALSANLDAVSTLDFVLILEAVVLGVADLSASGGPFWLSLLPHVRDEVLDAANNPGSCRGVGEAELPLCREAATAVAIKFFADLSGEAVDSGAPLNELQDRALDWLSQQ